jgi:hypothetical protein
MELSAPSRYATPPVWFRANHGPESVQRVDTRAGCPGSLRSCMLMPPSRTRKPCLRSNSAPCLAGETVQHVDMLCMRHSVCLSAVNRTSYMIASCMAIENEKNLLISYIIIQITVVNIKHNLYISCLLSRIDVMNNRIEETILLIVIAYDSRTRRYVLMSCIACCCLHRCSGYQLRIDTLNRKLLENQ